MRTALKNLLNCCICHITTPEQALVGCCGEPAETCACALPCICGPACLGLECDCGC